MKKRETKKQFHKKHLHHIRKVRHSAKGLHALALALHAHFRNRRKRRVTFALLLVLVFFGMVVYQNIQASQLLTQAENKMNQSQFEAAATDLQAANMPLIFGGIKNKIIAAQNQNTTWLFYSLELERASLLVGQGKFNEASEVLRRISQDFPSYSRVMDLLRIIQAKDKELSTASRTTNRSAAAASRKTAPIIIDRHFNRPSNFKTPPAVKSVCYQVSGLASRSEADRPDDNDDYQFHIIYVLPSDGSDRRYDTNGRIATSVSAWQNWLCNKTGDKTLKLDTYQGKLDVTFVRLNASDKTIQSGSDLPWKTDPDSNPYIYSDIENRLVNLGFNQTNKVYLVYYDGTSSYSCGSAGVNGMVYLLGDICRLAGQLTTNALASGYWELTMLHEALHALGFVPACAPNYSANNHVSISNKDLMYSGDQLWYPSELDAAKENYYQHGNADCLDLSRSAFLGGGSFELPPWRQ